MAGEHLHGIKRHGRHCQHVAGGIQFTGRVQTGIKIRQPDDANGSSGEKQQPAHHKYDNYSIHAITFHPATLDDTDAVQQLDQLLAALDDQTDTGLIFTGANADPRGAWVDCDDLNDKGIGAVKRNDLHYTRGGYELLGRRYVRQAKALIEGHDPADDGRPE